MTTLRFFVANLPVNTKEKHLRQLFQDYGEIENIEVKSKENVLDNEKKVIAFVTLQIAASEAQYCLKDLNVQKVQGQQIKVSLAKESFLERLKREREEAKETTEAKPVTLPSIEQQSVLLKVPAINKRKTFDEHGELGDDEVAPELMISKKRAISSMHNGKIFIPNGNVQPLHIIDNKKGKKKLAQLSDNAAEQKRKESLSKMKHDYEKRKSTIQQALQDENGNISKKIIFRDSASDEENIAECEQPLKTSKTNIFGSDDDDGDDNFELKCLPTGSRGEKLLKLQAKQSLDSRFRIDAKFLDEDNEIEGEISQQGEEEQNNANDERKWQMNILEQVVGTKIDSEGLHSEHRARQNKKMVRYDPLKDEHPKCERKIEEKDRLLQKTKTKATKLEEKPIAEVSKEIFYVVTDSLQQSLKKRGEGFSLLDMFGSNEVNESRETRLKEIRNEKILINHKKSEKSFQINPFNYDSSSTDDEEGDENIALGSDNATSKTVNTTKKNKVNINTETFFIPKTDKRLKEGFNFFTYDKTPDGIAENYEDVRHRLKQIIKTKIAKAKKNLTKAGYRTKKRRKL
uniref:RRM domain-containing protein n=1 Tax=Glossina austeni TaxID=7395 RepID=A0A1A9VRC6_GLOAU